MATTKRFTSNMGGRLAEDLTIHTKTETIVYNPFTGAKEVDLSGLTSIRFIDINTEELNTVIRDTLNGGCLPILTETVQRNIYDSETAYYYLVNRDITAQLNRLDYFFVGYDVEENDSSTQHIFEKLIRIVVNKDNTYKKEYIDNGGVFFAVYNSTTRAEINQALADGKYVICEYNGHFAVMSSKLVYTFTDASIDAAGNPKVTSLMVDSADIWTMTESTINTNPSSALITAGSTHRNTDGTFDLASASASIGNDIDLNNNIISCAAGWYHIDVEIKLEITSSTPAYTQVSINVFGHGQTYTIMDNSIVDKKSIQTSFDMCSTGGSLGAITITGISDNDIRATLMNLNIHKLSGAGGTQQSLIAGNGINIEGNIISVDSGVADATEKVQKLTRDLDTKLTVNFDMPNITATYDFANSAVTTLSNGATMLCQAFTVPINNDLRIQNDSNHPTLLGIYAKQGYGNKIMLALYVYDFETGWSDYVGDTGPVSVIQGKNEYPLKHINPNITELKSSCVYYASLYLPSQHAQGLLLAGCPGYGNDAVNAIPRFTIGVENILNQGIEIDMTDPNAGLYYNDGQGNYYIGPWNGGYNERPSVPRFFLQIRNGAMEEPTPASPFDVVTNFTLAMSETIADIFGNTLSNFNQGNVFQAVTPNTDIVIKGWKLLSTSNDQYNNDGGDIVCNSDFSVTLSSRGTCTRNIRTYGTIDGITIYEHSYTPSAPLTLTANTTYRFPVTIGITISSSRLIQFATPTVESILHLFESKWNISQWVSYARANSVQGLYLVLIDSDDNEYVV